MARHYTVEEATRQLPIVEPVLRDAVRLKKEFDHLIERLQRAGGNPEEPVDEANAIRKLRHDVDQRIKFITALGVQVKDLNIGLLDFPTVRNGKEVLLCWRLGEPAIAFWHTFEEGYPGRRRL